VLSELRGHASFSGRENGTKSGMETGKATRWNIFIMKRARFTRRDPIEWDVPFQWDKEEKRWYGKRGRQTTRTNGLLYSSNYYHAFGKIYRIELPVFRIAVRANNDPKGPVFPGITTQKRKYVPEKLLIYRQES
jgi:hypothetical protein